MDLVIDDIGNKMDFLIERNKEKKVAELENDRFAKLTINNVFEIVEIFYERQPFTYDRQGLCWFWNENEFRWEIVDEVDLMISISKKINKGRITKSAQTSEYLRCFQQIGREHIPKDPPKHWIQFKNKVFDLKTKETFEATPNYFFTNSIPWEIGKTSETPTMDLIFEQWVGKEYVKTLYEILAYCCYIDYPIHTLFCFIGSGRNGKSRFLALLNKFVGNSNCVSTELDSLTDSRFESSKLFKKSVCFMGETNFGILEKTSIIKKLTGQDLMGGEFKGKNPFDFVNYAKLCISSNSLPSSTDTSEGFYRRWMIVDFPNEFPEGKDILETIPEIEYENLANKVVELLPNLIQNGKFFNQGSIEERKQKYIMASNPLSIFIKTFCYDDLNQYIKYNELYLAYLHYLQVNKKRRILKNEFKKVLEDEGYFVEKTTKDGEGAYFILGMKLKSNWKEEMTKMTKMTYFPLNSSFPILSENDVINVINVIKNQENKTLFINNNQLPKIFQPCSICRLNPESGNFLVENKVLCEICIENEQTTTIE